MTIRVVSALRAGPGLLAALLILAASGARAQQAEPPPPAVVVERVRVQEAANPAEFTARAEAIAFVDIRARVQGFLRSVAFEEGQVVKEGDLLFEIEPDLYEARLASARAEVSRAEASRLEAERSLARSRELAGRQTVARATLDEAQAAFDIAVANVEVARAALRSAELNLSYTRIHAPIDGQIGKAALTRGNLVGPEAGVLARLVSLDPIRVVFSMTEGLLVTLRQRMAGGNGLDPSALNLTLRLPNGTDYGHPGRLEYVENEVNPQTGTVAVRAVFPNPDHILIPNQFVTLSVREREVPRLPVVPQTAVLQDRDGRFVYVVGEDQTVSMRRIETGVRVADGWAVSEGLSGGEPVVVQGIQRLRDGLKVQPAQARPSGGAP